MTKAQIVFNKYASTIVANKLVNTLGSKVRKGVENVRGRFFQPQGPQTPKVPPIPSGAKNVKTPNTYSRPNLGK